MIKRDWLLLAIGAQAFHTLSHIIFSFATKFPFTFFSFTITKQLNMWAILINLVVTGLLVWWFKKSE